MKCRDRFVLQVKTIKRLLSAWQFFDQSRDGVGVGRLAARCDQFGKRTAGRRRGAKLHRGVGGQRFNRDDFVSRRRLIPRVECQTHNVAGL